MGKQTSGNTKTELLLKSAARLYSFGVELEAAREKVRRIAESGIGYDSPELVQAVNDFNEMKQLWDNLEKEHLALREELVN